MSLVFRLLKALVCLSLVAVLALLMQFNAAAMTTAENLVPDSGWIVCLVLAGLELLACLWLWLAWFARAPRLVLKPDPTDEERRRFKAELLRRLRSNPHVKAAGLRPENPDFLPRALAHLDTLADGIIRADAKKIFLGTALSQNGKLDALIVFLVLSRMVWRVSALYNQRPTVQELWSVYSIVTSSTFIAFSLEALDIPRTITEAMSALLPAVTPSMTTASIPVVGSSVQYFTSSIIDGAANALLAVRAGVAVRNAFRFAALPQEASFRQAATGQSCSMLLVISQECVDEIVSTLREQFKSLTSDVVGKAAEKTRHAAGNVARATASMAGAAGAAVRHVVVRNTSEVSPPCPEGRLSFPDAAVDQTECDRTSLRIGLGERLREACPEVLRRKPVADEVFALSLALLWLEGRPGGRRRRRLCRYALQEGVKESLLRYLDTRPPLEVLWPLLVVWRKRPEQVCAVMAEFAPELAVSRDGMDRLLELEQQLKLGTALRERLIGE